MTRSSPSNFEQLVDSIEPFRHMTGITQEWFGLVLLPIVSFSADGAVAAGYFAHKALRQFWFKTNQPEPPNTLAKAQAIDLSIQFVLLWMPFLTLLGWWTNKPFSLLFGMLLIEYHAIDLKAEQPIRFL